MTCSPTTPASRSTRSWSGSRSGTRPCPVAGHGQGPGLGHDGRARGGRPRRYAPPYRPEVIDRLDSAGLLPAITFIFSRAGCDAAVQQCLAAGLRLTTAQEGEAIAADRRAPGRGHPGGGPDRPRLPRLAAGAAAGHRGAPRRAAARLQGGRRGAVHGRAGPRRLRHRDARARHQHARQDRGHRAARQVERRDARHADGGGVHPAHRAGRAARHRRRGARGRAVAARASTRASSRDWRAPGPTR